MRLVPLEVRSAPLTKFIKLVPAVDTGFAPVSGLRHRGSMLLLSEGGAQLCFLNLLGCEGLLEGCSEDNDEAPMVFCDGKELLVLQSRLYALAHLDSEDARLAAAVDAVSERLVEVTATTACEVRRQDLQIGVLHSCWLGGTDPFALLACMLVAKNDGVEQVV